MLLAPKQVLEVVTDLPMPTADTEMAAMPAKNQALQDKERDLSLKKEISVKQKHLTMNQKEQWETGNPHLSVIS